MSVRENTPTFKYVAVENLVITYNQKPYPIKNMYTNKKYIIWNIDRPNQLEDSNVRPEESLLEYLIVINDNGIPTTLSHDNLTLSFDAATNGFSSNGDFDSIKDQVNENTKKYNLLIKDVDGITNVIGKTEELKDGSIIYNLNKIKADSESFGVQLEEVKTQVDDKFKDLKPVLLNNLIDYSKSVSEYKLSLTSLKNDVEVTEEELSKINTNKTNMSNSLTALLTSLDSLKSILDSVNDETKSQLITDAKNQLTLLNNALINACDTALLDNKLSDYEKTTITQKAYELSQYIGVVQNTCNNITVGGSDGIIYKVQNEFLLYKDKTENNITELSRDGDLLNSKLSSYKQTMDEIDLSVKKVTSQYNEDKEMVKIKENIISLAIEENTLLGELSSIIKNAFEDDTISIEEKTNIQSKRDLIVVKKDLLLTEIDKVLAKLLESNDTTNHANLTNKKNGFSTSLVNMINKLNSIINKSNVTSNDTNTLVDLITTSKTKLTDLKNTCDEIISLGFGGAIYEQLSDFQIKSDGIISTVKEITQDAKGNIKSSAIKYYASTSQTELVGGKWEDTIPLDANKFIWIKIVTTYGDGTIKEGTPTCISSKGLNGADGVDGKDGVSLIYKGEFTSHPSNPQDGWYYRNTIEKKTFVYQSGAWYQMTIDGQDGLDGNDGEDGLSIEYKGELKNPPSNPVKNWTYKDSDNGIVYIYTGTAWEVMTYDGTNGIDGTDGTDGLSVFVTYHDSLTQPYAPTGDGTSGGWHTNCTSNSVWISQKVSSNANTGTWGTPIKIKGQDGVSVEEVVIEYAKNQSTTSAPYSGWGTTMPTYQSGYYLWMRTRTKYSNSSYYVYSTPVCDQSWKASQEVYTQYEQLKDKFTWVVKGGTSSSNMVLSDDFYSVLTRNIRLKAENISLEGLVTANSKFKILTDGSMEAINANISGKITVGEGSSVNSKYLNGTISNSLLNTSIVNGASNGTNAKEILNANSLNWSNAYDRVRDWAYGATTGSTTIDGAYLETGTVLAEKIAIGDFNNYVVLPPNSTFVGTSGITDGYEICSIWGNEKYNHANLSNKLYGINGGDKFRVKAFIKSDIAGSRLDITCCWRNANNEIISSSSIYTVVTGANEWTEVNDIITVPSRPSGASYVRFKINIQEEQSRRIYVERLNITRMYSGELIVDGSITSISLSADAIDGRTIKGAIIVGGELRGSSNFFTAPDSNATDGYGFRIYSTGAMYTNNDIQIEGNGNHVRLGKNGVIDCSTKLVSPNITTGDSALWFGVKGAGRDFSKYNLIFREESDSYMYFRPGNNSTIFLGYPSAMFNTAYIKNGVSSSSDRTLKENIKYLSTTVNPNCRLATDITELDLYNFVKNDLVTATYNFIGDDRQHIGFIAQDLLYNADGTDNIIGQLIVNKPDDERNPLSYNEKIYVNVLAGALRHDINNFEAYKEYNDERFLTLEKRLEKLEMGEI